MVRAAAVISDDIPILQSLRKMRRQFFSIFMNSAIHQSHTVMTSFSYATLFIIVNP